MNVFEDIALQSQIATLVQRDKEVMRRCPRGHYIVVDVSYRYVRAPVEVLLKGEKPVPLVPSGEPFTEDHFRALLELPLSGSDAEFVRFFERRKNDPCMPKEWVTAGFAEKGRFASVNAMCKQHGLWIRFRPAEPSNGNWLTQRHNFSVMKEKNGAVGRGS